jgi:GNAT superfamily N-acetyltransferase
MASDLVLRPATVEDVAEVTHLVRTAYQHYVVRIGREPAPMGSDYAALIAAGHTWVAALHEHLVGVIVLEPAADHLLVDTIAVAPDSQGLGIGVRLLDLAEDEARRLRLPELRLYTNEAMTENLAYYPRRGYHETHRASSDGYARVHFTKALIPEQ